MSRSSLGKDSNKEFYPKGNLCEQGHRSKELIEITRGFVVTEYDELRVVRSCRLVSVMDLAGNR